MLLCLNGIFLFPEQVAFCTEIQNIKTEHASAYSPDAFSDFHDEELTLYAKSAVILDASNGRILYGKDANTPMANASTTKILTCILALENASLDEIVTISDYACSMPKVKLGCASGETFYLGDLLYSLMLESHNDSAVAIAEHIAGSVDAFAELMNQKAQELGCKNSHFVTPNGLDSEDEDGTHSTTAYDLSLLMSYCIQNEQFLEITQTSTKQIQNVEGTNTYSLTNHNALLSMVDGVISGKTGFTANAGYCYVGAYKKDDRTYTFALLACGWPNHKDYKWSDAKQLIAYANEHYSYQTIEIPQKEFTVPLLNGVKRNGKIVYCNSIQAKAQSSEIQMLLSDTDEVSAREELPDALTAPAWEGTSIGAECMYLNGYPVLESDIVLTESAEKFDFSWCVKTIFLEYCQME
jgi:D-alanyl-D-alanine carboxypeptidase (penicillin-binding protein 5/6)